PVTNHQGEHYSAIDARTIPGCVQLPRLPLAVAAAGPRGFGLAARYGAAWVTQGPADWTRVSTNDECVQHIREHTTRLTEACARIGRPATDLSRMFMPTPVSCPNPLSSVNAFLRLAEAAAAAHVTDLIVHWPRTNGVYAAAPDILEKIAVRLPDLR
ncbi:LLM class flavin-dependent oxidoreductase, partial [Saccharothrix sp. MB29]|nr:LLM class flavin-dependent oxidoreductase [Saccharothrix sp. MB29]